MRGAVTAIGTECSERPEGQRPQGPGDPRGLLGRRPWKGTGQHKQTWLSLRDKPKGKHAGVGRRARHLQGGVLLTQGTQAAAATFGSVLRGEDIATAGPSGSWTHLKPAYL